MTLTSAPRLDRVCQLSNDKPQSWLAAIKATPMPPRWAPDWRRHVPELLELMGPSQVRCRPRRDGPTLRRVGPVVGPTPAFYSCVPTGMHGPACIFWADLTPCSLQYQPEMVGTAAGRYDSEMRLVARLIRNARTHMLDGRCDRPREAFGVSVTAGGGARPALVKSFLLVISLPSQEVRRS